MFWYAKQTSDSKRKLNFNFTGVAEQHLCKQMFYCFLSNWIFEWFSPCSLTPKDLSTPPFKLGKKKTRTEFALGSSAVSAKNAEPEAPLHNREELREVSSSACNVEPLVGIGPRVRQDTPKIFRGRFSRPKNATSVVINGAVNLLKVLGNHVITFGRPAEFGLGGLGRTASEQTSEAS